MGVKYPESEEELTLEVESFIDKHGQIDMQAMKRKGYDDSQICDIMNEYYLATAKLLAEYRKERKARETVMYFLQDANRLHNRKVEVIDKYMVFACSVKAAVKRDNKAFSNYENCLQYVADVKNMCEKHGQKVASSSPVKICKSREQTIRDCSSAENLSPSKYFRVPSPDNIVRGVKSCHDLHNPVVQRKRGKDKVEVVSRAPTPYPHFISHVDQCQSYTAEVVNVECMPKVKQRSLSRKSLPFVKSASQENLKKAINHYEDFLGLASCHDEASDEVASEPSDTSIKSAGSATSAADSVKSAKSIVCAASSSHSSSSCQDYVRIHVENTRTPVSPAKTHSCSTLVTSDSSVTTASTTSCIHPPPPSAELEINQSECTITSDKSESTISSDKSESTISSDKSESSISSDKSESSISSDTSSLTSTEATEYRHTSSMSVLAASVRSSQPDLDFAEELMRKCFSSESHTYRHFSMECSDLNNTLSLTMSQTTCNRSEVSLSTAENSASYCETKNSHNNEKDNTGMKGTSSPSPASPPKHSTSNNKVYH